MKFCTFIFLAALAVALFFVAERRPAESAHAAPAEPQRSAQFRDVMDLTAPAAKSRLQLSTRVEAPAEFGGAWTVDDIPAQRLIGSLVVVDVRSKAASNPSYEISCDDLDHWERVHGEIPPDGIVVAMTGRTAADRNGNFPAYSADAVEFLSTGRHVLALGSDAPAAIRTRAAAESLARLGIYQLSGVAGLNMVPEAGAILIVAPARSGGAAEGDARMFALLR
ncbi:MAG TPA: cyclase family protein [Terriglobales bacterium]|nr:cyclase family protein [Terriglobales bacterium]